MSFFFASRSVLELVLIDCLDGRKARTLNWFVLMIDTHPCVDDYYNLKSSGALLSEHVVLMTVTML